MTTFPALTPSGRRFTPGTFPHTTITSMSGRTARVRHGNVRVNQTVALEFIALTEAQMLQILTHYRDREGRFKSFDLPDELWSGAATPSWFTPAGYRWLYRNPPQAEEIPTGTQASPEVHFNVSVELEAILPESATLPGATWRTIDVFIGGAAIGNAAAPNAALTSNYTFAGGAAIGSAAAAGADLTTGCTFTGGAPSADTAAMDGAAWQVDLTLAGGAGTVSAAAAGAAWDADLTLAGGAAAGGAAINAAAWAADHTIAGGTATAT
jgi:hypothetical protein